MLALLLLAAAGLLVELRLVDGDGALGAGDDGEAAASFSAELEHLGHLLKIVGDLGDEDHVRAAADAGVQRQPAGVAAHELDHEDAPVGAGRGVQIVDDVGGDVHGALEAEGRVGAPDVVVDGLGQGHDVHPGVHQELGALLGAVAAHDDQTVQPQAVVGVEHPGDDALAVFVDDVLAGDVALARGAEYGAALGQNAGEVLPLHEFVVALDQAAVAVVHAVDLEIVDALEQRLADAADGGVQTLAVAAAGDEADAGCSFHRFPPGWSFCCSGAIIRQAAAKCNGEFACYLRIAARQ